MLLMFKVFEIVDILKFKFFNFFSSERVKQNQTKFKTIQNCLILQVNRFSINLIKTDFFSLLSLLCWVGDQADLRASCYTSKT